MYTVRWSKEEEGILKKMSPLMIAGKIKFKDISRILKERRPESIKKKMISMDLEFARKPVIDWQALKEVVKI